MLVDSKFTNFDRCVLDLSPTNLRTRTTHEAKLSCLIIDKRKIVMNINLIYWIYYL